MLQVSLVFYLDDLYYFLNSKDILIFSIIWKKGNEFLLILLHSRIFSYLLIFQRGMKALRPKSSGTVSLVLAWSIFCWLVYVNHDSKTKVIFAPNSLEQQNGYVDHKAAQSIIHGIRNVSCSAFPSAIKKKKKKLLAEINGLLNLLYFVLLPF